MRVGFAEQYIPVTESGCWLWTGALNPNGYGNATIKTKSTYAHRAFYELHVGKIPEGMFVLHKCDIKCCVNPSHLFAGTHKDNMADMVAKGRSTKGDRGSRKLSSNDVIKMRDLISAGVKQITLARDFNVSTSLVSLIKNNRSWRNI